MVLPGGDGVPIVDPCGLTTLAVMRAMGIPTLIPLVQGQPGAVSMKQRAADRKQAAAALEPQVSRIMSDTHLASISTLCSANFWMRLRTGDFPECLAEALVVCMSVDLPCGSMMDMPQPCQTTFHPLGKALLC